MESFEKISETKYGTITNILVRLDVIKNSGFRQYNFFKKETIHTLEKKRKNSLKCFYDTLNEICTQSYRG